MSNDYTYANPTFRMLYDDRYYDEHKSGQSSTSYNSKVSPKIVISRENYWKLILTLSVGVPLLLLTEFIFG